MTAVNLTTLLKKANKNNYAVAGLVVLGWEDALAYTQAADETGIPIILQAGPSCREHTPVPILGKMFRYLADQTKHIFVVILIMDIRLRNVKKEWIMVLHRLCLMDQNFLYLKILMPRYRL
mgnify:CR=1 FL=1